MVFLTESALLKLFGVFIATLLLAVVYFKRKYSYWKNLGVQYVEPTMPFGNALDNFLQKSSLGDWYVKFYQTMKARKLRYAGTYFFHIPMFVVFDPDMIKQIIQTDFAHFTDHGAYVNEKEDPLSAHIFSLSGQRWRNLRVKLTPTFTSGKMKMMFPILVKTSQELVATLQKECGNGPIDAKDVSARFTTDVIGNCAFGIDCNSLRDPNTEFRVKGKRVFNLTRMELLFNFLSFIFPNVMKSLGVRLFPKEATDFFWNVIKDTTEYREQTGYRRNDAMQLLLDMMSKDGTENENTLTFKEIAAQAFVFFIAGFETSSTLMSFALFELSQNENVQDHLRNEIKGALERNNGELTYETIWEMNYLGMVINESLDTKELLNPLSKSSHL